MLLGELHLEVYIGSQPGELHLEVDIGSQPGELHLEVHIGSQPGELHLVVYIGSQPGGVGLQPVAGCAWGCTWGCNWRWRFSQGLQPGEACLSPTGLTGSAAWRAMSVTYRSHRVCSLARYVCHPQVSQGLQPGALCLSPGAAAARRRGVWRAAGTTRVGSSSWATPRAASPESCGPPTCS